MRLHAPLILASLFTPGTSLPAQQFYGFITRLGRDTISLERVTRTASRLIGDGVQRNPRVMIRHYEAALAADGSVARFTIDNTPAASAANAMSTQHVVIDFAADSVRLTMTDNWGGITRTAIATHGMLAMPVFDAIYGPYEQLLAAALGRGADSVGVLLVSNEPMPPGANPSFVKRLPHDSAMFGWLGFPFYGQLDRDGRMMRLSGEHTPRKVRVERLAVPPNVGSMVAQFAAAQRASGGAARALSIRDTARGTIGTIVVAVDYGRPLRRGRTILGGLVPYDSIWRTGANEATQLNISEPVELAGISLDAGTYSLWTMPTPSGATLIVNRQTGQWGTEYAAARNIARAALSTEVMASAVDRFTIRVESTTNETGRLVLEWDRFRWTAEIHRR